MIQIKHFFLLSIILIGFTYSQPSEEQKQRWIQEIYSADEDTVFWALMHIEENGIKEAIPAVEANYHRLIGVDLRESFLSYLASYGSPNASVMINNYIDSIKYFMVNENRRGEIYRENFSDTLYRKIHCAQYLLKIGDYSRVQLIVDDIQTSKPHSWGTYWVQIYNELPQYASIIKPKIMQYLNDSTKPDLSRGSMLLDLERKQGTAFFPDMVELIRTNPDPWMRHTTLIDIVRMNYPNSLELLKERFLQDSYSTMKREIAETLLTRYGSINEYAFLKNNIGAVSRPIVAEMIQDRLGEFIPPKPSASLTAKDILDSLIVIVKTVQSQNWLGNQTFTRELTNHLENAKKHLVKGDSVNCGKEVEKFQEKVNKEYEKTIDNEKKNLPDGKAGKPRDKRFVTIEGWKFLYYNAQYIIDRLPRKEKK